MLIIAAMTVVASVGAGIAALDRLVVMAGERDDPERQGVVALTVLALPLVGSMLLWPDAHFLWRFAAAGLVVTGVLLVCLLIAAIARLGPVRVGVLLPLYLAGAGLFAYPAVALIAWITNSGALC